MPRRRPTRHAEIRRHLAARLQDLQSRLQRQVRDVRSGREVMRGRGDQGEAIDVDPQHDVELALLELQSETADRITGAIRRIDAGTYGRCAACDDDIALVRLRALPFATHCRDCASAHETRYARTSRNMPLRAWSLPIE